LAALLWLFSEPCLIQEKPRCSIHSQTLSH
jgi:hypothetical protein